MVEPTETASRDTLDAVCKIFKQLHETALTDPSPCGTLPSATPVRRLDEVRAARAPLLRYQFHSTI